MEDLIAILTIIKKIESSYPWWCFTPKLKAIYFIKRIRIERDKYQKENKWTIILLQENIMIPHWMMIYYALPIRFFQMSPVLTSEICLTLFGKDILISLSQ